MKKNRKKILKNSRENSLSQSLSLRDRVRLSRPFSFDNRQIIKKDVYRNIFNQIQKLRQAKNRFDTRIAFDKPKLNPVCIKREQRRKILFALGKAGKIKVKKAHWNSNSKISCKG